MSFPYKNPISPIQILGTESVSREKSFGTNYSTLSIGGYMEVFSLSQLNYTIPPSTYGPINYSGNSIPVMFSKGSGTTFSIDTLTLNPDNISSGRKKLGMLVYVKDQDQVYQFNINNYETLWNAATGATGTGGSTVIISDFGTTVKANSPEGIAFISGWTANTIDGISGETQSSAVWKKYYGTNLAVTGGTYSSGTLTLTNITGGTTSISGFGTGSSGNYLPLSGGTVYGDTIFTSGLTANTLNVTGLTQTYGLTSTSGIIFPQRTINSTYTATTTDYMIDITGGTFNVQLPTSVGIQGRLLAIKNNGGGAVTIYPYGSEKIDDKPYLILSETNAVQLVSNGSQWVILGQDRSTVNNSTGVFVFSGLSKVSSTQFSVAPVKGWIVDDTTNPLSPQIFYVDYSGGTHTDSYVSTDFETFVYLTSGGTISQQPIPLTEQQRRQNIFLGKIGHPDKTSINLVFSQPDFVLSPLAQLRDMFTPINLINGGVYPSANGSNLKFNTSAGFLYGLGINFVSSTLNPNALSISGTSPCTFQYRTQTGGTVTNVTDIDPLNYDVGGVKTPITGTKATNQRIFLLQNGTFRVQYGQNEYNTLTQAIEALQTETFTPFPNFINNAVLIGILTVLSTATDLTDSSKARFFFASKFGETIGAAGGVSTTNLQQAYNNSSQPEIIINSTLDGLSIKNGTGNADNITNLLEGLDTSGSTTSFIRADGGISGSSISAVTYYNLPTDIRVTGGTKSGSVITFTNNTGGTFNVTGVTDTFVTGGTYNRNTGVTTFTNSSGGTFTVTGYMTTAVTGGTYSAGTITLTGIIGNSTGNISTITGLTTTFTGGTVTGATNFTGGLSANTISATTYQNLPIDVRVTGGTYSSGSATFTNNTGGTFNVTGFLSNATTAVTLSSNVLSVTSSGGTPTTTTINAATGGTYSNGTITLSGTGSLSTITGLFTGGTDVRVTGATYNNNTFTFTNNTGGTFNVLFNTLTGATINGNLSVTGTTSSGIISATTYQNLPSQSGTGVSSLSYVPSTGILTLTKNDTTTLTTGTFTYLTGATYSNNSITLTNNLGSTSNVNFNTFTGLTINGNLSVTGTTSSGIISATTYQNLPTDIRVTGGTKSGSVITFTNNTGGTFNVTGITDTFVTGGTYSNGTTTFTNSTGGTFNVTGLTTPFTGGTVTGATNFTGGLSANTISGGTLIITNNIDTTLRTLKNSSNIDTIDWGTSVLVGTTANVYWDNGQLKDSGPQLSIDWPNRTLNDTNEDIILDWQNKIMSGMTNIRSSTISATTYQNLPLDIRVTGGTYSAGTATFTNNTGGTFNVTGFSTSNATQFTGGTVTGATNFTGGLSANTISATTINGNASGLTGIIKYYVTGSTPSGITLNNGDRWFDTNTGNELVYVTDSGGSQWVQPLVGGNFYGQFLALTGGTVTGNTTFIGGLTANTISATTYNNLPTDIRVTGATYSNNTFTYRNNTGGTFNVLFNTLTGLTNNGDLSVSGTTTLGNGTFTKAGFATGDVLLDNNSTDTPGVLFYYANNSNYGIDSWNGSYDVLSGQLVRITNKLNETGGAVKLAIDTSGNIVASGFVKANAWRAGQVVNDIMLSNTEVTVSTTTIATSNTDTDFVTYSYTPLSSNSYLVIHYHLASFSFEGGTGNDSYFSRIKVDGTEITYSRQSTVNGNRTGVLFPITGRYTNSNTTAKSIVVACRRDSADDSITIVNSATSMWLRITEIAR